MDGVFRKEFARLDVKRLVELGEPAEVIARFRDPIAPRPPRLHSRPAAP